MGRLGRAARRTGLDGPEEPGAQTTARSAEQDDPAGAIDIVRVQARTVDCESRAAEE